MTLTRMEPAVADALRTAAAIAVYQQASHTRPIHLILGLALYSEELEPVFANKPIRKGFEKWHDKLREPLLTIEDCAPAPTGKLHLLLSQFVQEGRKQGMLTEQNLVTHLITDSEVTRFLKSLKLESTDFTSRYGIKPEQLADAESETKQPFSDYLDDLTAKAKNGEINHIQGRKLDMEWLLRTLCQYRKKSAILIGQPGVGKTALVEELALQIVEGTVPEQLKNKVVYSLDVGGMVAGTKLRGQFEERMNKLIRFLKHNKDIILFIDEIHTIMSAGSSLGSSLNASNMLKPALSRGDLVCIGATTPDDVLPLEKDPAFKRRFQFRWLDDLTNEETLHVLKIEAKRLEKHYGVSYTVGGLKRILDAANDYYPHQFNPDKSLTLADAAGSFTRYQLNQDIVNTKAVNASLRAKDFKDTSQIVSEARAYFLRMFEDNPKGVAQANTIAFTLAGYLTHMRQPGILVLNSSQDWIIEEVTSYLATQLHNKPPILIDGYALASPDALTQLKGLPSSYTKDQTLLETLRYSPHRLVHVRHLENSYPEFKDTLCRSILAGDLLENNGHKLQLKHAFFIISTTGVRTSGFGKEAVNKLPLPQALLNRATVINIPKPSCNWLEDHITKHMGTIAGKVKSKIKVAYSSNTPAYLRSRLETSGEAATIRAIEDLILKASCQGIKRIVLTPEHFQDPVPF